MVKENKEDLLRRLRCVEGHTRGVARMVKSDEDCLEIVRQIDAIQGAMDKAAQIILQEHLTTCIPESYPREDPGLREELIDELADLFAFSQAS